MDDKQFRRGTNGWQEPTPEHRSLRMTGNHTMFGSREDWARAKKSMLTPWREKSRQQKTHIVVCLAVAIAGALYMFFK